MIDDLERIAAELVERQRTVHERVACPRCAAPVGAACCHVSRRWVPLKHSHVERLRADGIPWR